MRVLVVDDDEQMRKDLERFLKLKGHMVFTASNGEEALKFLQENSVHHVVSDYKMQKMNGLELLRAMRSDPRTAGIPFALMSGRMVDDNQRPLELVCYKLGATFWSKPFDPDIMTQKLFPKG